MKNEQSAETLEQKKAGLIKDIEFYGLEHSKAKEAMEVAIAEAKELKDNSNLLKNSREDVEDSIMSLSKLSSDISEKKASIKRLDDVFQEKTKELTEKYKEKEVELIQSIKETEKKVKKSKEIVNGFKNEMDGLIEKVNSIKSGLEVIKTKL